jgi:hypothetical protein
MLWLIPISLWLHILPALGSSPLLNGNNNHFILVKGTNPCYQSKVEITSNPSDRAYWSSNINAFSALAHAQPNNWILSLGEESPKGQWHHPVNLAQLFGKLAFAHAKYAILAPSLRVLGLHGSGLASAKRNEAQVPPALSKLLKISAQGNGIILRVASYENRPTEYAHIVRFFSAAIRKTLPDVAIIAELAMPDSPGFWSVSQHTWLKDIQTTSHLVDGYALFQCGHVLYSNYSGTSSSLIASGIRLADETKQPS